MNKNNHGIIIKQYDCRCMETPRIIRINGHFLWTERTVLFLPWLFLKTIQIDLYKGIHWFIFLLVPFLLCSFVSFFRFESSLEWGKGYKYVLMLLFQFKFYYGHCPRYYYSMHFKLIVTDLEFILYILICNIKIYFKM